MISWSFRLIAGAFGIAILAILAFRINLLAITWPLMAVAFACLLAAIAFIMSVAVLMTKAGRAKPQRSMTIWCLILAAVFLFLPLIYLRQSLIVPPIHDISTRPDPPLAFEAVLMERQPQDNKLATGAETIKLQYMAYPDIGPVVLRGSMSELYRQALDVVRSRGWRVVAADELRARIEAVAQSALFGFKDDVVIVLTPVRDGVRVDMRSVSRVGRSDLGVNARRIRAYLADLAVAAKE